MDSVFFRNLNSKKICIYFLLFYILFMPNLSFISPLLKNSILLVIFDLCFLCFFRKKIVTLFKKNEIYINLILLCGINILTLISTLLNHISISNNLTSVVFCLKTIYIFGLYLLVDECYQSPEEKIDVLLNVGFIQGIICIVMLIFPAAKNIANTLYISNVSNYYDSPVVGIVVHRIYGICGDYTFDMSFLMALLASISIIIFLNNMQKKYVVFSCVMIVGSILNGRTGFLLFLVVFLISAYCLLSKKEFIKGFFIFVLFLSGIILAVHFFMGDYWLNWLATSFKEIFMSIFNNQSQTTISTLKTKTFFPSGINLIFGFGSRVFGDFGNSLVGISSDIGYINDLWRGGVIYSIVVYANILWLMKKVYLNDFTFTKKVNKCFIFAFVVYLFVGNYKGEAISGSSILIVFLYFLFIIFDKSNINAN